MSKDIKHLSLRIDTELHKRLRMKLLQDEKSFQEWAVEKIREYVEEKNQ